MGSWILLMVLNFAVSVHSECKIHEQVPPFYNISALVKTVLDNDVHAVDDLLKQGCDVNYNGTVYLVKGENYSMDISGVTALHLAVWHNSEEFVEKLLTIPGIEVDPIASDGYTPLLDAVYSGNAMILKMLHAAGADMFALSRRGFLATNIAAHLGDLDVLNTLIELGADIDGVSGFGEMETPLISAANGGNTGVVAYLLGMGADMDVQDAHNKTALDWAVELGYEDVEQVLLYREKFGC